MTQIGSARYEGDTWDLASSVGLTATMVAAARAVAARDPQGAGAVASDSFAESLVRAVGVDFFSKLAGGELDLAELDLAELDEETAAGTVHFANAMAVRTRYFDDRTDAGTYLSAHGWDTTSARNSELFTKHGLEQASGDDAPFGEVVYLSAERH